MTADKTTLRLHTRELRTKAYFERRTSFKDFMPYRLTKLAMNVVSSIEFGDMVVTNPDHYSELLRERYTGRSALENVTVDAVAAERVVETFRGLQPGHNLECHDLALDALGMDWMNYRTADFSKTDSSGAVSGGEVYRVYTAGPIGPYSFWNHSAIGTDEGRLFGLVARGRMLATMSAEMVCRAYGGGAPAILAAITH